MRKVYSIAVVALLGLVFQSCGLKGPLRLPDRDKPPAAAPAATSPAAKSEPNAPDNASDKSSDKPKEQ